MEATTKLGRRISLQCLIRPITRTAFAAAMVAACIAAARPAVAQVPCLPRGDLIAALAVQYGERLRAQGVSGGGGLLEFFANGDGSSWTVAMTLPNGMSCLVATGTDWVPVDAAPVLEKKA